MRDARRRDQPAQRALPELREPRLPAPGRRPPRPQRAAAAPTHGLEPGHRLPRVPAPGELLERIAERCARARRCGTASASAGGARPSSSAPRASTRACCTISWPTSTPSDGAGGLTHDPVHGRKPIHATASSCSTRPSTARCCIQPKVIGDERGFFHETYRRNVFAELGIAEEFVQDNHSRSGHGIVRGMHFQVGRARRSSCAARAARSSTWSSTCAAARRPSASGRASSSPTRTCARLYCPIGFAHGFCVTSEIADVIYKQDRYYDDDDRARDQVRRPRRRGSSGRCRLRAEAVRSATRPRRRWATSPTSCRSSTSAS